MLVHIFFTKKRTYTYIYITEKMYNLNTTCQSLGFIIMALWQCAWSVPTAWIMATKPIWSDNLEHNTVLYKIIVFTKLGRDGKKGVLWCTKVWGTQSRFRQTLYTLHCVICYRYHDHDLLSLQTFHYNKSWFWYFSTVV